MGTSRLYLLLLVVFMVKAEEDFSELDTDDVKLREMLPDVPDVLRSEGVLQSGPSLFSPRSMGPPQIPFPLARPKPNNVQDICQYSNQRPRYPKEMLPNSGYGYLFRQANAVNQLEAWFSVCCSNGAVNEELVLCCAEQAWKKSLSAFCSEEFTVKTRHHYCCNKKGSAKWACFEDAAQGQSYQPSERGLFADVPTKTDNFKFNPATCQKASSQIAPRAMGGTVTGTPNIFPPGQPNAANIGSICSNRSQRRWYLSKCLSQKGNSTLTKTIIDLEKDFNQCCKKKKDKLACAERKWKTMVDDLCVDKKNADIQKFDCCENERGNEQYDCFASSAPNPDYIFNKMFSSQASLSLDMFCDMHSTYHSMQREMKSVEDFAGPLAGKCCHAVEKKNPACLHKTLDNIVAEKCNNELWRLHGCCKRNPKSRSNCVTKMILREYRAYAGTEYKMQKKCPVRF